MEWSSGVLEKDEGKNKDELGGWMLVSMYIYSPPAPGDRYPDKKPA